MTMNAESMRFSALLEQLDPRPDVRGRSIIDVARQMGHGADLTMRVYGHVIEELEDAPKLSAEDAIRAARATDVSVLCLAEKSA